VIGIPSLSPAWRDAGMPIAGPGAPPKRRQHGANPPQLQAARGQDRRFGGVRRQGTALNQIIR
jgi:hypothetical protein